jgi:CRP-like cAMP-binding protein
LIQRLETVADLDENEKAELNRLCVEVGHVDAKQDIIAEGDRPEHLHLIIKGWAARYKVLPDGLRQILAFLIPGDFCDIHITVLGHMDHGIVALTPCQVAYIAAGELDRVTSTDSRIARAMWWSTLVDEAVLRSWVVNIGRRDARERIAHLLCEVHARMKLIGLVEDNQMALPLTQEDLADAAGLTSVHTNRTLQKLRKDGLVEIGGGMLTIPDIGALQRTAGFDPNYLHIERRVR